MGYSSTGVHIHLSKRDSNKIKLKFHIELQSAQKIGSLMLVLHGFFAPFLWNFWHFHNSANWNFWQKNKENTSVLQYVSQEYTFKISKPRFRVPTIPVFRKYLWLRSQFYSSYDQGYHILLHIILGKLIWNDVFNGVCLIIIFIFRLEFI